MMEKYAKFLVVNKKNVVFHVYNERVLIERARSNAGMTEPTAFSVINTLNRMLDWIKQNPKYGEAETDTDYDYIVSKLFLLISAFNMSTIDTHVNDMIEYGLDNMGDKYNIFSAKKDYYTEQMDIFTKDSRIISIIYRYIDAISVDNTEKPKREKTPSSDKAYLSPPQFFTFCMLFVFSRIYYICWLTVMGAGDYTQLMKDSVFGSEHNGEGLSQILFEYVLYNRYPNYLGLLTGPKFIDVFIYQYIASFVTSQSITNKVLIDKFEVVGMNEYSLYDKVISEIFSGIHRIVPSLGLNDDTDDSKDDYDGTELPETRKYYFKKIAKYITSSITEILRNVITNYKPGFIMNTDSSTATDKENFDAIVNENKEHNQYLFAIKKDINEDAVASIRTDTLYLYEANAFNIVKHKLGRFMISQYLSIKYGITEPVNVLTHAEYKNIILAIYDRLDEYPKLKMAIVGVPYEQKNNASISLEDFEKLGCQGIPSFLANNVHKTLKILSDLAKEKYRTEIRIQNTESANSINDIREDLMNFMLHTHEVFV